MEIDYETLWNILWEAKRQLRENYRLDKDESELQYIEVIDAITAFITETPAIKFLLNEMPF